MNKNRASSFLSNRFDRKAHRVPAHCGATQYLGTQEKKAKKKSPPALRTQYKTLPVPTVHSDSGSHTAVVLAEISITLGLRTRMVLRTAEYSCDWSLLERLALPVLYPYISTCIDIHACLNRRSMYIGTYVGLHAVAAGTVPCTMQCASTTCHARTHAACSRVYS